MKFRFIYKSTKNCFIFWFFGIPQVARFFMSKFNVERSRTTVATNEPLRHENYNNQNARPFTLLCILWTTLCFRHTENVKIFLFNAKHQKAFCKMTQLSIFVSLCFYIWSIVQSTIWWIPPTCIWLRCAVQCLVFLGRKQPIISFEIWTIISIMMISKIKWHSPEYYYFPIKKSICSGRWRMCCGIFECIWDYPQTKKSNPIYTAFFLLL